MQTVLTLSFFAGFTVAQAVVWALLLRIGLRWVKAPDVNIRRIALATVLVVVFNLAAFVVSLALPEPAVAAIGLLIVELAIVVCAPAIFIMMVFKISFGRSMLAWLPTLGAPAIFVAFVLLVVRPYMFETFFSPTSVMAPTLLPRHWTGKCADCGGAAYCTVRLGESRPGERSLAICGMNFHETRPTEYDRRASDCDRFLVAKHLKPRRWDIVAFQYPGRPERLYVMRLVGLPGEEITIRDGKVYANGKPLTPPASIGGIRYASDMPTLGGMTMWGSADRPAKLGGDEYFVLGDFSQRSADSRLWDRGAPGHNPFAVPESHLRGVVTHIYWPPARWRAFR